MVETEDVTSEADPSGNGGIALTVVCAELPFPDDHGGKVDVWRRLQGFKRLGVRVQLVTWATDASPESLSAVKSVADDVHVFPFRRALRDRLMALALLPRCPPPVSSRRLTNEDFERLTQAVRAFCVDAIWLDGLYGCNCAERIATALNKPLLYRSHNIEHLYWREQLAAEPSPKARAVIRARLWSLKALEFRTVSMARVVFDISAVDQQFWATHGARQSYWLPPLASEEINTEPVDVQWDVGFVGNLKMPSNVEGVLWLLSQVLPRVERLGHAPKVVICGSRPDRLIVDACKRYGNVELLADVEDPGRIRRRCRVLVNPILRGGGVSLRTVDVIASGRPSVVTPQALRGISEIARQYTHVAETADEFAEGIASVLNSRLDVAPDRVAANVFGLEALRNAVEIARNSLLGRREK